MKRFILCLAALLTLAASLIGCGSTGISIEGEADDVKVYTYPANNIIGLEKIAVFEDHVTAVFDIDKCDAGHAPLKYAGDADNFKVHILSSDVFFSMPANYTIETESGSYILRAELNYNDERVKIPEQPFVITGLSYDSAKIEFSDECTNIECEIWGGECSQTYYQTYEAKSGKWLEAEEEFKTYYFGPPQ